MTSDAIEFLRWLHGDAAVNLVALKGRDSRHAQFSTADEAGIDKWIKAWNPTHGL